MTRHLLRSTPSKQVGTGDTVWELEFYNEQTNSIEKIFRTYQTPEPIIEEPEKAEDESDMIEEEIVEDAIQE